MAIDNAEANGHGCVLLSGHFNLGVCFTCLTVTGPVTIAGQADPTSTNPNPRRLTVVGATGGLGLLNVDEPENARSGVIEIRDIWWRGSTSSALKISNFYRGSIEIISNRITNISPFLGQRFPIYGTAVVPGKTVRGDTLDVEGNYIDVGIYVPIGLGDDNPISFLGCYFNTVNITGNTLLSRGETEYELTSGSVLNISNNTIVETKHLETAGILKLIQTVGYPGLHGGLPTALALRDDDFTDITVRNNDITSVGGAPSTDCMLLEFPLHSVHPSRSAIITGNRCDMQGGFAAMQLGWIGLQVANFNPGIFDNAVVNNNTFVGTASFGIAALDLRILVPRLAKNSLINTSNNNVFANNDLSHFTASKASLYLGPETYNNTFIGNPHGLVVDKGTGNRIIP